MESIVINHAAVVACAVLNLVIGAVWYSPALFYEAWREENKLTEEELKRANPFVLYGVTFVFGLIMAYNLAFFLGDSKTDWQWGLTAGFLTGAGWASLIFATIALFERKSWRYIFINSGYIVLFFSISGLLLGLWR